MRKGRVMDQELEFMSQDGSKMPMRLSLVVGSGAVSAAVSTWLARGCWRSQTTHWTSLALRPGSDPVRLNQVLLKLAGHAVKSTPSGCVGLSMRRAGCDNAQAEVPPRNAWWT